MSRYLLLGLFCFCIFFMLTGGILKAEEWTIESGKGIGIFGFGDRIDSIESVLGRTKVKMGDLYWYKPEGIEFYAPGNSVDKIIIVKAGFGCYSYKTSSGISVGSRSEEVLEAYGYADRNIYSWDTYILEYPEKGITFFIRHEAVRKIVLYKARGAYVFDSPARMSIRTSAKR